MARHETTALRLPCAFCQYFAKKCELSGKILIYNKNFNNKSYNLQPEAFYMVPAKPNKEMTKLEAG